MRLLVLVLTLIVWFAPPPVGDPPTPPFSGCVRVHCTPIPLDPPILFFV